MQGRGDGKAPRVKRRPSNWVDGPAERATLLITHLLKSCYWCQFHDGQLLIQIWDADAVSTVSRCIVDVYAVKIRRWFYVIIM